MDAEVDALFITPGKGVKLIDDLFKCIRLDVADIQAADGEVGDDIDSFATSDLSDVDCSASREICKGFGFDNEFGQGCDGVSSVDKIATGVGGASMGDDRHAGGAFAAADDHAIGKGGFEDEADVISRCTFCEERV